MGVDAVLVDVEVDMSLGLPYFNVVGLPDGAAKESKVRVISALKNTGYDLPQKRITVNLAPADLRKDGPAFELPLAIGVLIAARLLSDEAGDGLLLGGELSLDGAIKAIRGVLPLAVAARDHGFQGVMVPKQNAAEAAVVDRIQVFPVSHLREAIDHLTGVAPIQPLSKAMERAKAASPSDRLDLIDVRGQPELKAALELAAAGGHNILFCGPPGSGKTMLARRLPSILPSMTFQEALEVTKIYSVLGLLTEGEPLIYDRPFRSPHHTISDAGLVGGGPFMRPGELSMAHHGVLFLDELPEFRKNVLDLLRQPLEEGAIHLARASHNVVYPCRVMLVAAMNPCPCGYFNVPGRSCRCSEGRVVEYFTRVSGPLLDRIDVTLQTRALDYTEMTRSGSAERPSAYYRARVDGARERQRHRFRDVPGIYCNAQMTPVLSHKHCVMSAEAEQELGRAIVRHALSARAHDRILKMALTRADLEGHALIESEDIHLAVDCRILDRRNWLQAALSKHHLRMEEYMFKMADDAKKAGVQERATSPPS